jgi:hypothetical protein
VTDTEHHRINSLAEQALSPGSNAGQDDQSGTKREEVTIKLVVPVAATGGCAASLTGE